MAGVGDGGEDALNPRCIGALLDEPPQVRDFQPALLRFDDLAGAEAIDRDEQHRLGNRGRGAERGGKKHDGAHDQNPALIVTKNCCGAPTSSVWRSPLLLVPAELIVPIYFLSNRLLALSCSSILSVKR